MVDFSSSLKLLCEKSCDKAELINGKLLSAIFFLKFVYNSPVFGSNLRPIRLSRRPEPFDSDEFIYELKVDGFRALLHLEDGKSELVSRSGNTFHGFAELATWLAEHLKVEDAVLDSEIACIDREGRPVFKDYSSENRRASSLRLICCT